MKYKMKTRIVKTANENEKRSTKMTNYHFYLHNEYSIKTLTNKIQRNTILLISDNRLL